MAGVLVTIKLWSAALIYGTLVILHTVKQFFTLGFGNVLYWKRWDRPKVLDDPSFGTHGFLTLKEVTIHYVASGPEGKPLMLFVHGFPEFWYSWRYQIKEFQKDYRVVAIDQRGYSESSKPAGIQNYTMVKLMSDLEQVIQALGYKSCVLVAHDWGGAVAWSFARHYENYVEKLIIMNAPPSPVFKELLRNSKDQRKKSWYMFFFQLPCLPEWQIKLSDFSLLDELFLPRNLKDTSENIDKIKEEYVIPYKYTFSQPGAITPPINYYRASFRLGPSQSTYNMDYTMPVLLIWGCQDKALDIAIANETDKASAKITVEKIENANHFVQIDAPNEVNKIMRQWLGKQ